MKEISLKHFKSYIKKLERFAKSLNIVVEYKEENCDGVYIPNRSKIRIDHELEESTQVAVFLHELGHAFDYELFNNESLLKIEKSYDALYSKKPSAKHRRLVLKCERNAWKYGRMIAYKLKIPLGAWYDQAEAYYLGTYK